MTEPLDKERARAVLAEPTTAELEEVKKNEHSRSVARLYTRDAFETLVDVMNDPRQPGAARISAAKEILARGWGTPAGEVEIARFLAALDEDVKIIKFEMPMSVDAVALKDPEDGKPSLG